MSFLYIPMSRGSNGSNTFVGVGALQNVTTGVDNSAFGFYALNALVSGNRNTAVGSEALLLNTSSNNTAVGSGALRGSTTGQNNVALGQDAMRAGNPNNSNVAVGYSAMYNCGLTENSVGIGQFALYNAAGTIGNTAVGNTAGLLITTGSKNTILGAFTGNQFGLDIRTLSNYIVLSDGDGNPRLWIDNTGAVNIPGGLALTGSLSITGGTVTANNPVLSATQTWNNAAVTFTGWQLNVTDTASAAASLLMNLQVGGSSRFYVSKAGTIANDLAFGSIQINPGGTNSIVLRGAGADWGLEVFSNVSVNVRSTMPLGWATATYATPDLQLWRDAANTLAQRNGVNAQTLRVYNTFTDASNYERGVMQWSGNILTIGAEGLGTGAVTPRVVNFIASNTSGSRRVATMRAASQVAMEVVGQDISTPPPGVGTLTVFTKTNALAEAALDLAYTDGFGNRQGGFRFRDTQTAGDWVACQMEMAQSTGDGNRILSELADQNSAWPGLIYISRTTAGAALTTSPAHQWRNHTTTQLTIDANNNIVCNNAAIATNATNGFLYVPGCAGTPTGTPTAYTGRVPIVVDTTNNKLYFYSGGAWRDAGP